MKNLILFFALTVGLIAQPTTPINNARISGNSTTNGTLQVANGGTLEILSGSTIKADAGSTVTGFGTMGNIGWGNLPAWVTGTTSGNGTSNITLNLTANATTLAGFGITNGIQLDDLAANLSNAGTALGANFTFTGPQITFNGTGTPQLIIDGNVHSGEYSTLELQSNTTANSVWLQAYPGILYIGNSTGADFSFNLKTGAVILADSVISAVSAILDNNNVESWDVTNRVLYGTDGATGLINYNNTSGAQLSGVPTAPTAAPTTNTTQIATTAFVQANFPVPSTEGGTGFISWPASTLFGGNPSGVAAQIGLDGNLAMSGNTLGLTGNSALLAANITSLGNVPAANVAGGSFPANQNYDFLGQVTFGNLTTFFHGIGQSKFLSTNSTYALVGTPILPNSFLIANSSNTAANFQVGNNTLVMGNNTGVLTTGTLDGNLAVSSGNVLGLTGNIAALEALLNASGNIPAANVQAGAFQTGMTMLSSTISGTVGGNLALNGETFTGSGTFNGTDYLSGTTDVNGTINFSGSTIQNIPTTTTFPGTVSSATFSGTQTGPATFSGVFTASNAGVNLSGLTANGVLSLNGTEGVVSTVLANGQIPYWTGGAMSALTINSTTVNTTLGTLAGLNSANLTTNVVGTLPVANGGTGVANITANTMIVGNGTNTPYLVTFGSGLTLNTTNLTLTASGGGGMSSPGNTEFVTTNATGTAIGTAETNGTALIYSQGGPVAWPSFYYVTGNLNLASNTTIRTATGLTATLVNGTTYLGDYRLYTVMGAGNMKMTFNGTATASYTIFDTQNGYSSTTGGGFAYFGNFATSLGTSINCTSGGASNCVVYGTFFITCNGSGSFNLQWAQSSSSATNTTIVEGSWMRIWPQD